MLRKKIKLQVEFSISLKIRKLDPFLLENFKRQGFQGNFLGNFLTLLSVIQILRVHTDLRIQNTRFGRFKRFKFIGTDP